MRKLILPSLILIIAACAIFTSHHDRTATAQQRAGLTPEVIARRNSIEAELQSVAVVDRKVMIAMRDGKRMAADVYRPKDASKKYPTVFNLYEQFFDDTYNGTMNVLTSNGYVVVQPSVNLEIGHPGESWVKGVTAAANKLIEMGVTDQERLGVMGTSYGGYATNLLITAKILRSGCAELPAMLGKPTPTSSRALIASASMSTQRWNPPKS